MQNIVKEIITGRRCKRSEHGDREGAGWTAGQWGEKGSPSEWLQRRWSNVVSTLIASPQDIDLRGACTAQHLTLSASFHLPLCITHSVITSDRDQSLRHTWRCCNSAQNQKSLLNSFFLKSFKKKRGLISFLLVRVMHTTHVRYGDTYIQRESSTLHATCTQLPLNLFTFSVFHWKVLQTQFQKSGIFCKM